MVQQIDTNNETEALDAVGGYVNEPEIPRQEASERGGGAIDGRGKRREFDLPAVWHTHFISKHAFC